MVTAMVVVGCSALLLYILSFALDLSYLRHALAQSLGHSGLDASPISAAFLLPCTTSQGMKKGLEREPNVWQIGSKVIRLGRSPARGKDTDSKLYVVGQAGARSSIKLQGCSPNKDAALAEALHRSMQENSNPNGNGIVWLLKSFDESLLLWCGDRAYPICFVMLIQYVVSEDLAV
jgi:hypothetical protein